MSARGIPPGVRSGGGTAPASGRSVMLAPAKLTLNLRITGVRADGYHELESEMVSVDLADTLEFAPGDGLTVEAGSWSSDAGSPGGSTGAPDGPAGATVTRVPTGPDNLVAKALRAVGRTAEVRLVKRIPAGAGLGGGSSDAAAVLRWAGCADQGIAAGLGADVAFCVAGGRAMVSGIGDVVAPLAWEDRTFTLLLLPFGVDTAACYRAWDRLAERGALPVPEPGRNDLEAPAIATEPRLAPWRDYFAQATGLRPRLAGSGSTWFVEGLPADVGLEGRRTLALDHEESLVVGVRTVPTPV